MVQLLGPLEMSESCFMGAAELLSEPLALMSLWVELRLAECSVSMACRGRGKGWDFFVPPLRHTEMKQDVIAATRIRPKERTLFSLLLSLILCCSLSLSPLLLCPWAPSSPVNIAFFISWWFPCGYSVTPEVWYLWGPDSLDTGVLLPVESSVLYEDSSVTWRKIKLILLKFWIQNPCN